MVFLKKKLGQCSTQSLFLLCRIKGLPSFLIGFAEFCKLRKWTVYLNLFKYKVHNKSNVFFSSSKCIFLQGLFKAILLPPSYEQTALLLHGCSWILDCWHWFFFSGSTENLFWKITLVTTKWTSQKEWSK